MGGWELSQKPATKARRRATSPRVPSKPAEAGWVATLQPIGTVKPYPGNPRKNEAAVAKVSASIREFGFRQPIVVDEAGVVIAGHTRLLAAQALGLSEVPVHVARGLSKAQAKAYRLADNRVAQEAEWDMEALRVEIGELSALDFDLGLTGFDADELSALLSPAQGLLPGVDPDDVPPVPAKPITKPGDLITLGQHRLLCGDSTSLEDVGNLLGGARADLTYTDPPYGVGYTGGAKKRQALAGDEVGTDIYGRALPLLEEFAADHAALYLWYADAHAAAAAAAAAGYVITAQVIWVKNHAQFVTSAHYKGKHEPCFYAHRRGKAAAWYGANNEVTTWVENRSPRNDFHPTQKPVALAARAIRNSSRPGDRVLDLFAGSGSTLVACEQEGRNHYAMEIDPGYCDVIVSRWENATGKKAERP